jgi:ABC-type nitrate/sulfonate/bicarbonate transport system permease component
MNLLRQFVAVGALVTAVAACRGAGATASVAGTANIVPAIIVEVRDAAGAPAAVLGAVIGEWFGARRGIGVLLVSSMQNLQVEQLWAAALTAAAVSLLAYVLLVALRGVVNRRFS